MHLPFSIGWGIGNKAGGVVLFFRAGETVFIEGKCGVTELGNHLDVTSAAASQMLERLVQQELILRTEDPKDRRGKQIVLTDKGNQVLEEGIRARQKWLGDLTETLSEGEKETIMGALNILISG